MHINDRPIDRNHPPYIIAELSANHNGDLDRAFAIIDAIAASGAHAVKLQTYTADSMTMPGAFTINDPASLWHGRELYELYQEAHTPLEWHKPLFDYAHSKNIAIFSSAFDQTSLDFLEQFDPPCYKIASFENTDLPLIKAVAQTKKPIIMSTGAATITQLAEAVDTALRYGSSELVLLKCTSTYPASPTDSNLATIPHLRELFGCEVGLSDHTTGIGVGVASTAFGSVAIEKHVTLRRADGGVDSAFSLEPEELQALVEESEKAWQAIGSVHYNVTANEQANVSFKRSLYIAHDLPAGHTLQSGDIRVIRPSLGLAPRELDTVIGRTTSIALTAGTPLQWDMLV